MSPPEQRVVTLITDFGLIDPFVGMMKGVMLGIAPGIRIVDLTHGIPSHDISQASMVLRTSYGFFPEGSVHVVVVDPGVGSSRRPILIVTKRYFFIGPDNGVLSLAAELEGPAELFQLTSQKHFLNPVSNTFHGRDVFSPAAAWVCRGTAPELLGERIPSLVSLNFPRVRRNGDVLIGTVLWADKFGNLVTNITAEDLSRPEEDLPRFAVQLGERLLSRLCRSYAEAAPGEVFLIWGSLGLLEISMNQVPAAEALQVGKGQEFVVLLQPFS